MSKLLSVLIPTVTERYDTFNALFQYLDQQVSLYKLADHIEVLFLVDNKEMSIGMKRNSLYKMATGKYAVMWDDDDWISHDGLSRIVHALACNPDCVGYKELCIFDGKRVESSDFSIRYGGWADNQNGFNHVRTPFFKTPIRTELCQQIGVADMRFGEDHLFAQQIHPCLMLEEYIDEFIYIYRHNSSPHNERYGIK